MGGDKFVCSVCGCIDHLNLSPLYQGMYLCSEHNPTICKWHDKFPKREYEPDKDLVVNHPSGITFD